MTPVDQKILKFIQTEKLAMQRYQKGLKKQNSIKNMENSELTPADKARTGIISILSQTWLTPRSVVLSKEASSCI